MNGTTSVIGPDLLDRLGEEPLVSLRVGAAVSPVPERQVIRLLDDPRALGLGARVVAVDVVDERVDLGCAADIGWVAESSRRLAEIDQAAAGRDLELGVQAACGAR